MDYQVKGEIRFYRGPVYVTPDGVVHDSKCRARDHQTKIEVLNELSGHLSPDPSLSEIVDVLIDRGLI